MTEYITEEEWQARRTAEEAAEYQLYVDHREAELARRVYPDAAAEKQARDEYDDDTATGHFTVPTNDISTNPRMKRYVKLKVATWPPLTEHQKYVIQRALYPKHPLPRNTTPRGPIA